MARLLAVRLPIAWTEFGFASPWRADGTVLAEGSHAWAWDAASPVAVAEFTPVDTAAPRPGWGLDHVVLLVPDVEAVVNDLLAAGADLRLRMTVRDRPTAFFRVGTILEVIETPVPSPRLYGVALVTAEPLPEVAERWRASGHDVSDPRAAVQEGREILTVRDGGAGFAVMSPDTAKG